MWSNQKMKFASLTHNDDAKSFHMALQGTNKLVVMGHINFEDHALIKRQRAYEKMNVTSKMFKDLKKQGNCQKRFVFIVGSCAHFQSSRVHSSMSVESVIEKLQQIAREKEGKRNEHK
jgi:hypothetical protein